MELQYQDADRRRMSIQVASNASATDNAARKRSIINLAQETTSVATLVGATGSLKTSNDTSISSTQVPSGAGRRFSVLQGGDGRAEQRAVHPAGFLEGLALRSQTFDFSNEADRTTAKKSDDSEGTASPATVRKVQEQRRVRVQSIDVPPEFDANDHVACAAAVSAAIPEVDEDDEEAQGFDYYQEDERKLQGPFQIASVSGGRLVQSTPPASTDSSASNDDSIDDHLVPDSPQAAHDSVDMSSFSFREKRRQAETFGHHMEISAELHESFNKPSKRLPEDSFIGTFTCRGMDEGKPKPNQDYACFCLPFGGMPGTGLLLVCDGHGHEGDDASQEVLNSLLYELEENSDDLMTQPGQTIADAFEAVNIHLRALGEADPPEINTLQSGACAVLAYIKGSTIWVAGVGDCQAYLGAQHENKIISHPLSVQHSVDSPGEKARLESLGAYIRPAMVDPDGEIISAKVYRDPTHPEYGPGLAISRSFGDLDASDLGIIATPEITCHRVSEEDKYLILATDGVWEFLGPNEVLGVVDNCFQKGMTAEDASKFVIALSANQWKKHDGDAYRDDITVVVVYLQPLVRRMSVDLM